MFCSKKLTLFLQSWKERRTAFSKMPCLFIHSQNKEQLEDIVEETVNDLIEHQLISETQGILHLRLH